MDSSEIIQSPTALIEDMIGLKAKMRGADTKPANTKQVIIIFKAT